MQFDFTIQPIPVCLVDSSMREREGRCILKSLDEFYSVNRDKIGWLVPWFKIRSVITENYWMYFISLSASEFICLYCVQYVIPQRLLFLCAVMGKENMLSQCVIPGIKTECPIYLEYNIAKIYRELLFITTDVLFLYVCHGNKVITRSHDFFFPSTTLFDLSTSL